MLNIKSLPMLTVALVICFSCVNRKANEKELAKEEIVSEISDEAIKLLEQSKSVIAVFADLKNQNIRYVEMSPDLSKFNLNAERNKLSMRFGMLSAAMAYEKVMGNKTQLPGLIALHQRFAKELNVDPFLLSTYQTYTNKVAGKEIDDALLEEIKSDLAKKQVEIVDKIKKTDEEFLVYYTMGILAEISYYKTILTDDQTFGVSNKTGSGEKKGSGATLLFITKLYDTRAYGEYATMFKPMIDILTNADNTKNLNSGQKENMISESIARIRDKALE